ncbi:MAG: neutral zinc metallopeptidase [Thermosynechococcaceae cyanobacterium]
MKWQAGRRSSNVEDRRGSGVPTGAVATGGLGTIVLALIVIALGGDPSFLLDPSPSSTSGPGTTTSRARSPEEDQLADFTSAVLADTEDTWNVLFRKMGRTYQEPKLVLFTGAVQSACGFAQAAVGPFYCPGDQKVYIDLSFYQDLKTQHQAPGDFAQAYVVAHEVGHHVQTLLGISQQVQAAKQRVSEVQGNQLSVRQELQADCFAGVWAHHGQKERQILEEGDVEEALNAASSIGDDRLQRQARGYISPESFTHGSSEQRVRWFTQGIKTGDINQCNTFEARRL